MQRDTLAYLSDILEAAAAIPKGRQIIDFRNLLTHEYLNVNDTVVWGAIHTDLPVLIEHCREQFSQLEGGRR
jgi:uncharacterized protein with HEPN domain